MFVPKIILRPLLSPYDENNFYNSKVFIAPQIVFSRYHLPDILLLKNVRNYLKLPIFDWRLFLLSKMASSYDTT